MTTVSLLLFPPFDTSKRHVLALDGGGVRGILTLQLLDAFERQLGRPAAEMFDLFAGTSAGGIIAALIAFSRMTAAEILVLYRRMIGRVFRKTLRSSKWGRLLTRRMYDRDEAIAILDEKFGDLCLRDLATRPGRRQGILLTTHDLVRNEELFLSSYPFKSGKRNLALDWRVRDAVAATALSAPWYFGPWNGRYIDGGATVFNTPCRQAAFEALDFCADPRFEAGKTVVWSFGSGAFPSTIRSGEADRWWPWNWAQRLMNDIGRDAENDQIYGCRRLETHGEIEFHRYDVEITADSLAAYGFLPSEIPELPIPLDAADAADFLDELGRRAAGGA